MKIRIKKCCNTPRTTLAASVAVAVSSVVLQNPVQAYTFDTGEDWTTNLDTSVTYNMGWRAEGRDDNIGNALSTAQGDYKFDQGDMVTNRLQTIVEFQAVYQGRMGLRMSGSAWKDFAYDDHAETNPNPAYTTAYDNDRYSSRTKKYHVRGAELLDAFVFNNFNIGEVPVYAKLGRLTQQWGNALFFGFSSISYGQHPTDFIKGFSQPGSEVKELFLPRTQALVTAELSPELSVSAQYFMEYAANRFPEGGTYLAPADMLYEGPDSASFLFGPGFSAGKAHEPKDISNNFGVKVDWAPEWAGGNMGFYFRKLDETQPWALAEFDPQGGGNVHLSYARNVNLYGFSYEKTIGATSLGFEINHRTNTALSSSFTRPDGLALPYREGARGDITNVLANAFVQLGTTPFYDTGILLAEATYTHLDKVTENKQYFIGKGYSACNGGGVEEGCATKNALAVAVLFSPQWLQVFPSIDISAPVSVTYGVNGNPAYAAGSFYAEDSLVYSVGLRADYRQTQSLTLAYQDYYWDHLESVPDSTPAGKSYAGGNGPFNLNDKGWVSLTYKTSF